MNRQAAQDPLVPLLLRITEQDKEAFAALYEATHHRLTVYLHRLVRRRDIVEDILVETYIQVWKSSVNFKFRSMVMTWIIGIARNIAFKEMKQDHFHDNIEQHPEIESDTIDIDQSDRKRHLAEAMEKISSKHREILDLAFFQELSYREIGRLLDINESTVKTRVYYAKAALKKSLAGMGIQQDDI
jgi:RNA polymerase sigma-70 factor (ECF subfamily)